MNDTERTRGKFGKMSKQIEESTRELEAATRWLPPPPRRLTPDEAAIDSWWREALRKLLGRK